MKKTKTKFKPGDRVWFYWCGTKNEKEKVYGTILSFYLESFAGSKWLVSLDEKQEIRMNELFFIYHCLSVDEESLRKVVRKGKKNV